MGSPGAADDGVRLAGWFLPRPGAPAVVLLHGYPAEKADLLPLATALAPEFATLLVDQRYFGQSESAATCAASSISSTAAARRPSGSSASRSAAPSRC